MVFIVASLVLGGAFLSGAYLMSAATDRLSASANTLSIAVDAAVATITALPGGDDTAINAVSDTLDALTAKLNAATPSGTPTA